MTWDKRLASDHGALAKGHPGLELFVQETLTVRLHVDAAGRSSVRGRVVRGAAVRDITIPGALPTSIGHDGLSAELPRSGDDWVAAAQPELAELLAIADRERQHALEALSNTGSANTIQVTADAAMFTRRAGLVLPTCSVYRLDGHRVRVAVNVVAEHLDRSGSGFHSFAAGDVRRLREHPAVGSCGQLATAQADQQLYGQSFRPDKYRLLLSPGFSGLLLHETCGHGLEGDVLQRPDSYFRKLRGKRASSSLLSVTDVADDLYGWSSVERDDEGYKAGQTALLSHGVVVGHLSNRESRAKLGGSLFGSARRQSHDAPPVPRMSSTVVAAGESSPEDLIAGIRKGIFVTAVGAGGMNPSTGDFRLQMLAGFWVEHGVRKAPIGAGLIRGHVRDLQAVIGVGNDPGTHQSLCDKHGQKSPVTVVAPSLLVDGLHVAAR